MPLFFKTQTFDVLANRIKMLPQVSSIFVSVEQLAPDERAMFRKLCDVDKVYDRWDFCIKLHIYPLITRKRSNRYNELAEK